MEEMKLKFRMHFFFYAPLQSSSKPHAPLEFRNGIKAGDLKTGDMIQISFKLPCSVHKLHQHYFQKQPKVAASGVINT